MLLAQIEAFLTVAERRSVSEAAGVLYVTQPALTTRIKNLERELGVELFIRTPRGMLLTAEGRAFRAHAQRAVQSLAEGRQLGIDPSVDRPADHAPRPSDVVDVRSVRKASAVVDGAGASRITAR